MRRPGLVLALASVLCVVTAVIGFGGDYINSLFRSGSPAHALAASSGQPSAEASTLTPAPQRDEQSVTVYITRTGERYHRGSCQYLSRSKYAVSLRDAKRQGYTPCKVCRPAR